MSLTVAVFRGHRGAGIRGAEVDADDWVLLHRDARSLRCGSASDPGQARRLAEIPDGARFGTGPRHRAAPGAFGAGPRQARLSVAVGQGTRVNAKECLESVGAEVSRDFVQNRTLLSLRGVRRPGAAEPALAGAQRSPVPPRRHGVFRLSTAAPSAREASGASAFSTSPRVNVRAGWPARRRCRTPSSGWWATSPAPGWSTSSSSCTAPTAPPSRAWWRRSSGGWSAIRASRPGRSTGWRGCFRARSW